MLSVRNLSVFYGPIQAVRDISFDVAKGEIVALLGANGAGKSSTLNAVMGLAPNSASEIPPERRPDRRLAAREHRQAGA